MSTITEFPFDEWVRHAQQFIEGLSQRVTGEVKSQATIEPPLSPSALASLESELGRPTPAALRAFLERGAGSMDFSYRWTATGTPAAAIKSIYRVKDYVWGGGAFCKSAEMPAWLRDCQELAADPDSWLAEYPEDLAFWKHALPIFRMRSGDYLALDGRQPADNPAVVYLSHDDESKIIALSFKTFLAEWERLHYIGPNDSLLGAYYDDDGLLSADTDNGKILRGAFGAVA